MFLNFTLIYFYSNTIFVIINTLFSIVLNEKKSILEIN